MIRSGRCIRSRCACWRSLRRRLMSAATFDLYVIGDRRGFYVGQAKRVRAGGWERRIRMHRGGPRDGSPVARRLLRAGARSRCVGSVCAEHGFVNGLEARLWDAFAARGWRPVHPRPVEHPRYAHAETARNGARTLWALAGEKGSRKRRTFVRQRSERRMRSKGMSPRDAAKLAGKARHALPAAKKQEIARKISAAARRRWAAYTEADRRRIGAHMSRGCMTKKTPERRREISRAAGKLGAAATWGRRQERTG
jgi:hypothetical protein